jgi:DNA-binding transcriptional regulator YiaG
MTESLTQSGPDSNSDHELAEALRAAVEMAATRRQLPDPIACRKIRQRAGLSRPQLAAAIGVTDAALSLWEAGRRRPNAQHAERYLTVLRQIAEASGSEV